MRSLCYTILGSLLIAGSISGCRPQLETSEDWYEQGMSQVQDGQVEAAIASFDQTIALGHLDPAVYVNRGLLYDEQGNYAAAIADYSSAIQRAPELDEAYYNRGNTHHKLREFEKSVADYSKAIEIRSDYVYAYANRSMSYEQAGELDKAIADLNSALKLFRADGDAANESKVSEEIKRLSDLKAKKSK
jgi:tetratricopeptide (TPR) repeat protein